MIFPLFLFQPWGTLSLPTIEPSVCRRDEQNPSVCHIRFRSILQARPDRRSQGTPVPDRFGPNHRGVARAAERRRRRRSGTCSVPIRRQVYDFVLFEEQSTVITLLQNNRDRM